MFGIFPFGASYPAQSISEGTIPASVASEAEFIVAVQCEPQTVLIPQDATTVVILRDGDEVQA